MAVSVERRVATMRVTMRTLPCAIVLLACCGESASRPDRELDAGVDALDTAPFDLGRDSQPDDAADDGDIADDGSPDACPTGQTECTDEDGTARCVDLQWDECHCGTCGNRCACNFGGCTGCGAPGLLPCLRGLCGRESSHECVDVLNSPEHCGGCNMACAEGEHCNGGACEPDEQI